jgi:hypothetical protein
VLAGAQPVGLGASLDDVGFEGDPVHDLPRRAARAGLRSTATLWRNTSSSTSFDADERLNNNSRFSSRRKIR